MEILAEERYDPWREKLWAEVIGTEVLEIGVGTGKNIPYYSSNVHITAIDLAPGMLEQAQRKTPDAGLNSRVDL